MTSLFVWQRDVFCCYVPFLCCALLRGNYFVNISNSSITAFLQCRQLHHYRYDLNLEPLKPNFDLLLGKAIHYALERWYGHGEDPLVAYRDTFQAQHMEILTSYTFSEDESVELLALWNLGFDMLSHYIDVYKSQASVFSFVLSEFEFCVPIPDTDGFFEGRIDGIIEDEGGDLWIIEHKTAKSFPDPSYFDFMTQPLQYLWAMQQVIDSDIIENIPAGTPLRGWCYNGLRKAVPKQPKLLKNEREVSIAAIDSTYEVYLNTLQEYGFDPTDERYRDTLSSLQQQGNTFFSRQWWLCTKYELRMIEEELQAIYEEMSRVDKQWYRTPTPFTCPRCPFLEPCQAEQKGSDAEYLIANFYRTRKTDIALDPVVG